MIDSYFISMLHNVFSNSMFNEEYAKLIFIKSIIFENEKGLFNELELIIGIKFGVYNFF